MGKDKLAILLDNPTNIYYPGQVITGRLNIELESAIKVTEIRIKFKGSGRCSWSEGSGDNRRTYTAIEHYCKEMLIVLGKDTTHQESVELSAGQLYTYPFSFPIPPALPGSYESYGCYVRYVVKATIDRPWALDKHVVNVVNIASILDLNTWPDGNLLAPGEFQDQKTICCCCCESDPITAVVRSERKGYVPGDTVVFSAEINNMSGRQIKKTESQLIMIVTLIAGGRTHPMTNVLGKIEGGGPIEPGQSDVIRNQRITIPSVPPSYLLGCNIIDIRYYVAVLVVPSGMSLNLHCKSEIVVGSIPLASIASQYGLTVPSAPPPTSIGTGVPTGLYNDSTFANMPQASFAESTFGRSDFGVKQKTEEEDEAARGFVPRYTYYKWNQQDPADMFTVKQ